MAQFQFNATQYAPRYDSTAGLPAGRHPVVITESMFKPTKDSTPSDPRSFLELKLEAIDGPAKGGSIPDRLTIQHPNQQTVIIAYSQLAAYCAVTGKQGFNDTAELHNIPFLIEVGPQRNNDQYTEVKGVYFLDGRSACDTRGPPSQQPQQGFQPQPQGSPLPAAATPPYTVQPPASPSAAPAAQGFPSNVSAQGFQPGNQPPWGRK
jgi:hypothetical protein